MSGKQNHGKVVRVQGLRASGAAGRHADRRTKRQRTRAAQKKAAISAGW